MDNRPSRKYLRSLHTRYLQAGKKAKGVILDEFTQTTGCNRDYARHLLSGQCQYAAKPIRHPRARYYNAEDAAALEHLSELLDGLCSKLLKAEIPLVLTQLREDGLLEISDVCAQHLLEVSPATHRSAPGAAASPSQRPAGFYSAWANLAQGPHPRPHLCRADRFRARLAGPGFGRPQRRQRQWRICPYFRHGG